MSLSEVLETPSDEIGILGYELISDFSTKMGAYYSGMERPVTWQEMRIIQVSNILIAANGGKAKDFIEMPVKKGFNHVTTPQKRADVLDALARAARGTT